MDTFITKRAFIGGLICCVLVALLAQYSVNIVRGSYMAIDHMPAGAIFIFFVLVFILNGLVRRIRASWALSPNELLLIYLMMFVVSAATEMGFGSQLLPVITGPTYYANPENNWAALINPHLRDWLVVKDENAVKYFYEGLPKGMAIPYGAWLLPVASWLVFIFLLYFVSVCLMVVVRKEWVEREKLTYPLTQLPMAMVRMDEKRRFVPPFFKNPLMWLGFGIAFAVCTLNALHNHFNMVPQINLANYIDIFRRTSRLWFRVSFPVIGFVYLCNLEISLSVWVFNLLYQITRGTLNVTGVSTTENIGIYGCSNFAIFGHVGFGAMAAMFMYNLFLTRDHLKTIWRSAIGKIHGEDADEILSYRTAFWGLLFGLIALVWWLRASGMAVGVAVLFLVNALMIFFVLTRVICESGIPTFITPIIASSATISMLGSRFIGPAGMVALALSYVYSADIRTFVMSPVGQTMKIVEKRPGNRRLIFWIIMAALLVNVLVSLWLVLTMAYKSGGINLNGWYFGGNATAPYTYAADLIKNPTGPNALGWFCRALGAVVFSALMWMRQHFLWWQLHPIGFAIGMVNWLDALWFSVFIAWLIKKLILRYGGAAVYEQMKFFFYGLPLGTYTCAGIWFIIDLIVGKQGNTVFWI